MERGTWSRTLASFQVTFIFSAYGRIKIKRISKAMMKGPDLLQQAKTSYEEKLPVLIDQIAVVSSNTELDDASLRFEDILRQPFESNRRPRPDRYRYFLDVHLDSLAK